MVRRLPSTVGAWLIEVGGSATGAESITQCSSHNDDWCCNGDDVHVNCCKESPAPRPFFALQDGKAYATIDRGVTASSVVSLASITGIALATGSGGGSQASKTPAPSSSAAPSSATANAALSSPAVSSVTSLTPVTSLKTSVSLGTSGVVTLVLTVITTPSATPTNENVSSGLPSSPATKSSSKIGIIVGCAVGIPLALALAGIIFWILRKRRAQKANPYKETSEVSNLAGSPGFGGAGGKLGKKEKYRHSQPGSAEIDSNPVGPGRVVSQIPGHAELDSGTRFNPGHGPAYTPDMVGIGGGNGDGRSTWNSAPPGYSPGANQAAFPHSPGQSAFAHPAGVAELDASNVLPVINEAAPPQQYQAYRPPQPVAEMPTVKTPPEDLERQIHHR
jgi:hypothetical protein